MPPPFPLLDPLSVDKAVRIVVDSKTHYPAACNALETLLVHENALARLLPAIGAALEAKGVSLAADAVCRPHLPAGCTRAATEEDYDTEFLSLTLAIKCVDSVAGAMAHINAHGSSHTDCIVTENKVTAEMFMSGVDASGVYHNASTRFADGFRYGFGAEVGISTNRIHSRGPVGVDGLLIYKVTWGARGGGGGVKCCRRRGLLPNSSCSVNLPRGVNVIVDRGDPCRCVLLLLL